MEKQQSILQKEEEKTQVGEIKSGINLHGYCNNKECLAAKSSLEIWINIGNDKNITLNETMIKSLICPNCKKQTIELIDKVTFYNSEFSIQSNNQNNDVPMNGRQYQSTFGIKSGVIYQLNAKKIRQPAKDLDDLIKRSGYAMESKDMLGMVAELEKYDIKVVKPKLKELETLKEKIEKDYKGEFRDIFDIGRFTILCEDEIQLQTAVTVMKKAAEFNMIVSEDKDFFTKISKTHHRFHNIKLYVPNHDVYVEMQATLKNFTTLKGHSIIENPSLAHEFYELIRRWEPTSESGKQLKQASDELLTQVNDIICEWIELKEIEKMCQILSTTFNCWNIETTKCIK